MFNEPKRYLEIVPDDSRGKIMRCIEMSFARNGVSPTIREICEFTGFTSHDTVQGHLDVLEKQGYIRRLKGEWRGQGKGRNIRLTDKRYFF